VHNKSASNHLLFSYYANFKQAIANKKLVNNIQKLKSVNFIRSNVAE